MRTGSVRSAVIAAAVVAARSVASAAPCGPAVALPGDPALVAAVTEVLAGRGVDTAGSDCPAVQVELERSGAGVVVIGADQARVVSEPVTAANVIESWTQTGVDTPLLAIRPIAEPAPVTLTAPSRAAPPRIHLLSSRGIQVFAAAEAVYASDRTEWFGTELGA